MMRDVLIWRESVYRKEFHCNICDTKIANSDGSTDGRIGLWDGTILQCPKCHNVVAVRKQVDLPEGASGCLGNYGEWERRQKHDRT